MKFKKHIFKDKLYKNILHSIYSELIVVVVTAGIVSILFGVGVYYLCKNRDVFVSVTEDYSNARKNCDIRVMSIVHETDQKVQKKIQDVQDKQAEDRKNNISTQDIIEGEYENDQAYNYYSSGSLYELDQWYEDVFDDLDDATKSNICVTGHWGEILWDRGRSIMESDCEYKTRGSSVIEIESDCEYKILDIDKMISESYEQDSEKYIFVYLKYINYNEYYIVYQMELEPEYIYFYGYLQAVCVLISAVLFFAILILAVRHKIRYIIYLSGIVDEISKGDLMQTVRIQGTDELATVAASIDAMQKNLNNKITVERKNETRVRELITNVSHDLKTPLTIITGYLDVVNQRKYESQEQSALYIEKAYKQVLKLNTMINKIFLLAKDGEAGEKLNLSKINFTRLVKQVISEYQITAQENGKDIQFTTEGEDVYLEVDVEQIITVLDNLFINALKYSQPDSLIKVMIQNEESSLLFCVSNNSDAIGNKELIDIFEKFYRADKARNTVVEGNGIGLALAKEVVLRHNGGIWAEYDDGIFTIKIRFRKIT